MNGLIGKENNNRTCYVVFRYFEVCQNIVSSFLNRPKMNWGENYDEAKM